MTASLLVVAFVVWAATFAFGIFIGVLIGRHSMRHQETPMIATRIQNWYDTWAPLFVIVVAIGALLGIILGAVASFVNLRQDQDRAEEQARRDQETSRLLACFDQFASAQSSSSKAVREAAVKVDEATTVRDDALNREGIAFKRLVQAIRTESLEPEDFDLLQKTLADRQAASRKLDVAQDQLDRARENNPVPDPPSEFCAVKP